MRDVAQHAGVSVATVSRVLSGTAKVSSETHSRVTNAINHLSFVPSAAARAINSGRTHLIGALVPTLDHAIFSRFLNAMEETLSENGLSLVVATTDESADKELQRARDLLNLGIEGLVVSGITRANGFMEMVGHHDVPVIATSYYDPANALPTIGYDNAVAARRAADHLLQTGHRRIAVLSPSPDNNDRTRTRLEAVRNAEFNELTVAYSELATGAAMQSVGRLMSARHNFTAILCLSDVLAHAALWYCAAKDIDVPHDLAVVGIDDLPGSPFLSPPLSSVHLPVAEMGKKTARAMADWVNNGVAASHHELTTRLVVRRSTTH